MKRRGRRRILASGLAALSLLLSPACGGGGGGGDGTPTDPGPVVTVAANLDGTEVEPNLLEVALLWDGVEIGRSSHTEVQLNVGLVVDLTDVTQGAHTVTMMVVRQASSPWPYDLNGSVFVGGAGGEQISIGHTQAELATGESVSTQVTIPAV